MAQNKSYVNCNLLEMNRKELTKINNDFSFLPTFANKYTDYLA